MPCVFPIQKDQFSKIDANEYQSKKMSTSSTSSGACFMCPILMESNVYQGTHCSVCGSAIRIYGPGDIAGAENYLKKTSRGIQYNKIYSSYKFDDLAKFGCDFYAIGDFYQGKFHDECFVSLYTSREITAIYGIDMSILEKLRIPIVNKNKQLQSTAMVYSLFELSRIYRDEKSHVPPCTDVIANYLRHKKYAEILAEQKN